MSKRLWKGLLLERLRRPVSLFTFSALVSIGTLLLYNIPFFSYVADNSRKALCAFCWKVQRKY